MSKTETTQTGIAFSKITSRTQVDSRTVLAPPRSHANPQYNDGTNPVYPASDYSGMNTLTRDPVYSPAKAGSIIVVVNSSTTTADPDACPPVRSIVGDAITLVDRENAYNFTMTDVAGDTKATARITPTAVGAIGQVGFRDSATNGGTIKLRDANGNSVVYVFDNSVNTVDGSVNGSDQVIVGTLGNSGATPHAAGAADAADFAAAVNATTSASNGLTLNITASVSGDVIAEPMTGHDAGIRSNIVELTQTTPGTLGNVGIVFANIGANVYAVPFIGGKGLDPKELHGATLMFKDVAGTIYSATCSAGTEAGASFTFDAIALEGSTVTLESTNGTVATYEAVGDCDDMPTGGIKRLDLTSISSVQTVYYQQGTSPAQSAQNLAKAMAVGHAGEIITSVVGSAILFTQRVGGTAGNTTISCSTSPNFTDSVENGGSYNTGEVGSFAQGADSSYTTDSIATKIAVGGITTPHNLGYAIGYSLEQARTWGVDSTVRGTQNGVDLAIDTPIVNADGYVDVTMSTAGPEGNNIFGGTLIAEGHARAGRAKATIVINSVKDWEVGDYFTFFDGNARPNFLPTNLAYGGGSSTAEEAAAALETEINGNSVINPFILASASGGIITIFAKIPGRAGDNFSISWTPTTDRESSGDVEVAAGAVAIQGVSNEKNSGVPLRSLVEGSHQGFSGGGCYVNAGESPQSPVTLATTLAAAINSKASANFSATVLTPITNSSGDVLGRLQIYMHSYGDYAGQSYVKQSHVDTFTFESPDSEVVVFSKIQADFVGGSEALYSQQINLLGGASRGDYDNVNPSSVQYINSKAATLFGFNPNPLENDADYLNNLLLSRGGIYEYPTWRQIRGFEHKIARELRSRNVASITPLGRPETTKKSNASLKWPGNTKSVPKKPGEEHLIMFDEDFIVDSSDSLPPIKLVETTSKFKGSTKYYYEPVVTTRHNPFVYEVQGIRSAGEAGGDNTAIVRSTLFNGLHFFTNPEMNQLHMISDGAATKLPPNIYLRNKELYSFFHVATNEIPGSRNFLFREQVFPKEVNTFRRRRIIHFGGAPLGGARPLYEEFPYAFQQGKAFCPYGNNNMLRRLSDIRSFWRTNKCDRIRREVWFPWDSTAGAAGDNMSRGTWLPPLSALGYPLHSRWSSRGFGREMSHGLYSKPNLDKLLSKSECTPVPPAAKCNPKYTPSHGQPWYGPGIAVWYTTEWDKFEDFITLDDGSTIKLDPGATDPDVYGVGYAEITCSTITKAHVRVQDVVLIGPDFDGVGGPDFLDPTPTGTVPGYVSKDWVGPGGAEKTDAIQQNWTVQQKMDHQPYDFGLTSMWPLDWPAHIATVPQVHAPVDQLPQLYADSLKNITGTEVEAVSIWRPYGGQYSLGHVCLGLAPNRLGTPYKCDGQTIDEDACTKREEGAFPVYAMVGFGACQDNWPKSFDHFELAGQEGQWDIVPGHPGKGQYDGTYPPSFRTGAAGELIYSTKPTITFYKRRAGLLDFVHQLKNLGYTMPSPANFSVLPPYKDHYMGVTNIHQMTQADRHYYGDTNLGYATSTASFQYLRHAWPYFQPLWRLDELTGRTPMYNSYLDFVADVAPMSRDYSILPEFRLSLNQKKYDEILDETKGKDLPVYVLNTKNKLIRNLYKPVKHVADFLTSEGTHGATVPRLTALPDIPVEVPIFNFISQSAGDIEFPAAEEIYHYIPADDIAATHHNQTTPEESWRTDRVSVAFYERYGHTETGVNFSKLLEQSDKAFAEDNQTVPSTVRLSFRAIKKLLPYKDFYPVNRTITLGAQLVDVYTSSIGYDPDIYERLNYTSSIDGSTNGQGPKEALCAEAATFSGSTAAKLRELCRGNYPGPSTLGAAATQSFIESLFAPGIMYNSIKSGLAVSYPLYHKPPRYFGNPHMHSQFGPYAHRTISGSTETSALTIGQVPGSSAMNFHFDTGQCKDSKWKYSHLPKDFIGMGYGSMMGVASAMPTFLMNKHTFQMPFEALYNLDALEGIHTRLTNKLTDGNIYMVDDFFDCDRGHIIEGDLGTDPHSWTIATGSWAFKCTASAGAPGAENLIFAHAAWPSDIVFNLASTGMAISTLPQGSVITYLDPEHQGSDLSPDEIVIYYDHDVDHTKRAENIRDAINTYCTGSDFFDNHPPPNTAPDGWQCGAEDSVADSFPSPGNYFSGKGKGKQILTASADGGTVTVHSAHSLALDHQRLIHWSASAGLMPVKPSGSLVPDDWTSNLCPSCDQWGPTSDPATDVYGGGEGFLYGSGYRNTAEHAFRPHFTPKGPTPGGTGSPAKPVSIERRIYESSINNFLAETVNFFIERTTNRLGRYYDLRMPMAISTAKDPMIKVQSGKTYYMTVNLYMGESQVMCEGPRFADVPYIRDFASASMRGAFFGPPMEVVHRTPYGDNAAAGIYAGHGPSSSVVNPLKLQSLNVDVNTGYTTDQQGLIDNITDPAYHHVTPPYFYGPSSIIMKYQASESEIHIKDLVTKIREDSLYFEEYVTGLSGSKTAGYSDKRFPSSSLCPKIPTPESVSTGSVARMKIESSLDIFGTEANPLGGSSGELAQLIPVIPLEEFRESEAKTYVWAMMPKWVCPVLDFGLPGTIVRDVNNYLEHGSERAKDKVYTKQIKSTTPYYDYLSGRSMWLGYGYDPYSREDKKYMEGYFDTLDGIYKTTNKNHPTLDLDEAEKAGLSFAMTDPTQDKDSLDKKGIWFQLSEAFPENFSPETSDTIAFVSDLDDGAAKSGYATKRSEVFSPGNHGSLMSLLGFPSELPMPIGKIANHKNISEAIVAIPYFEEPWWIDSKTKGGKIRSICGTLKEAIIPGKYFLKIDEMLFANSLGLLLTDHITSPTFADNKRIREGYDDYESALAAVNAMDLGEMIKRLAGIDLATTAAARVGYMIPPEFDFINNSAIKPFQMVVAPFEHTLDRMDLMNIWQNLMPDVSMRASKVKTDVVLRPGTRVLTENVKDILGHSYPASVANNPGQFLSTHVLSELDAYKYLKKSSNYPRTSAEYFKKLRWMVFKVKQRAAQDYDKYRARQVDVALRKQNLQRGGGQAGQGGDGYYPAVDSLSTKEIYGSNWPYDYFSLIEKAKIDIEYEVSK